MGSTSTAAFRLAQINVGRARAPLDDELMTEFVALNDEVNAIADRSPGFVWRLASAPGSAAYVIADDLLLINLSVWQSVDSLRAFVYSGAHRTVLGRRREWFERFESAAYCLWWVGPDEVPTVEEGRRRLALYDRLGPSPAAFDFKNPFEADRTP